METKINDQKIRLSGILLFAAQIRVCMRLLSIASDHSWGTPKHWKVISRFAVATMASHLFARCFVPLKHPLEHQRKNKQRRFYLKGLYRVVDTIITKLS